MSKKEFKRLLAASKTPAIEWVAAGLPVTAEGHILSEAQATNIEAALEEGAQASAALVAANTAKDEAVANLATATASLATANTTIAANTTKIAELEAEVARLGALDAGKVSTPGADGDPNGDSKPKLSIQAPQGDPRFS